MNYLETETAKKIQVSYYRQTFRLFFTQHCSKQNFSPAFYAGKLLQTEFDTKKHENLKWITTPSETLKNLPRKCHVLWALFWEWKWFGGN